MINFCGRKFAFTLSDFAGATIVYVFLLQNYTTGNCNFIMQVFFIKTLMFL